MIKKKHTQKNEVLKNDQWNYERKYFISEIQNNLQNYSYCYNKNLVGVDYSCSTACSKGYLISSHIS